MEVRVKTYDVLTKDELYEALKLRTDIFVVEQDCPYPEVDGKDQKALHILVMESGKLAAYARAFKPGDYFQEAAIGRVAVSAEFRGKGYGKAVMEAAIKAVEETYSTSTMAVSAQTYLRKFYSDLGFKSTGEEYPEDDIPHIRMVRK